MKKSFILITSLFFSLSTFAQETNESKTRYYRHEVNISIGGIRVRSGWSNDYERSVMNQFGLVVGRTGSGSGAGTGIIHQWDDDPDLTNDNALKAVSYYYHFNNHIAVGGLFGGCRVNDWLGYPDVYKPATAGFHYQSLYLDSETIPKEQTDEFDKSHLSLGYYITPFGWEIGKQKVRWFMEFGLGSNTNFQTGLTYRFGRY